MSVQDARLDLRDPGERHAHQYVQQAIRGEDRMWCLLSIGRKGAQLLCVVRWVKQTRNPKPYSLVALELTEPALRWHDYASVQEAQERIEPALVRMQVRSITVWLPAGVHIRIPQEVPEAQLRAVLETIGARSC